MSDTDKSYDTRMIRHQMRRQKIDLVELEKHLAKLPDDAEHAVETDVRFEGRRDPR